MATAPLHNSDVGKVMKVNLGSMLSSLEANMKAHQTSLFALSQQEVRGLKQEVGELRQELGEVRKHLDQEGSMSKEQEAKERHEYLVGQLSSLKMDVSRRSPDKTTGTKDIKGFKCNFRCKCRVCHFYNKEEGSKSEQEDRNQKPLQSEKSMSVLEFSPGQELRALMEESNIMLEVQEVRDPVEEGLGSLEKVCGAEYLELPSPPQVQIDYLKSIGRFVQNREVKENTREQEKGDVARGGRKRPCLASSQQEESTPQKTNLTGPKPISRRLHDTKPRSIGSVKKYEM